ncbi:tyrosine-type recombinase/integrase [Micromonospora endolithica]|uniref:tyrosine-type recombinase/integrase n=1 Tax=Micromonospora endolithica TaxID=230091 RepID=UPI00192DB2B3|nr:tyrosine-type recombinase/integrase [Micromonospora endolithica]
MPLLQIVPSKTDQERLLLVTPELASVLASIIHRVRGEDGRVPLVSRYDEHERVTGPALPHLFQRKQGWRTTVISTTTVQNLLNVTIDRAGLVDRTGQPLRYTPHDFRRMFAIEAVTGGLPVHITARILGHRSLSTTQTYLAVFQDELIRSYRALVDQRRAARPAAEYREPHRRGMGRVPATLPTAHARTRHLRTPLWHTVPARARLHPLPDAARRPRTAPASRRDHQQPEATH